MRIRRGGGGGRCAVRAGPDRIDPYRPRNVFEVLLAEIEEALVPAFIIEELADGRYTVFVPSVPTPPCWQFHCSTRSVVALLICGGGGAGVPEP